VKKEIKEPITAIVSPAVAASCPAMRWVASSACPPCMSAVDGEFQLRRIHPEKGPENSDGGRHRLHRRLVARSIAAIRRPAPSRGRLRLIDRSGGTAKVGVPLIALAGMESASLAADKLPPHLRNKPA